MRAVSILPCLLPLLATLACGGAGERVVPAEGPWAVIAKEVVQDDCGLTELDVSFQLPGGFELEEADSSGFRFLPDNDDQWRECSLEAPTKDGTPFDCEDLGGTEGGKLEAGPYDMGFTWSTEGLVLSEDELEMDLSMDLSCAGDGCAEIADHYGFVFPCALRAGLSAEG